MIMSHSRPGMKLEKVTLWTSIPTYDADPTTSALDYLLDTLNKHCSECTILDYDAEEYTLVKKRRGEQE
jgi:hypothetical protein